MLYVKISFYESDKMTYNMTNENVSSESAPTDFEKMIVRETSRPSISPSTLVGAFVAASSLMRFGHLMDSPGSVLRGLFVIAALGAAAKISTKAIGKLAAGTFDI